MAKIDLRRSGDVDYYIYTGNSFVPGPVSFEIDDVAEDFTDCTLLMELKQGNRVVKQLTELDGISVSGNTLQYDFTGHLEDLPSGQYIYTVVKTDSLGIDVRIQHGTINLTN